MTHTTATKPESIARISGTDATRIHLEGALCVQRGTPMLQAFASGKLVVRQKAVDIYDPNTEEGYQRAPVTARIKAAAGYYEKGGRMPNPLLMNVREDDFDRVRVTISSGDRDA